MTAKLRSLRKETIHQFDTVKYPFLECAREILEFEAGRLPDLEYVHHSEMGKDQHTDGSGNKLNKLQAIWNSNRCRIDNDFHLDKGEVAPNYERLDQVYHNFLLEVIAPQMGGGTIQYQRAPTLRVYTPSTVPMGKMHNDCDYNHQPSEINFWLPLTSVFGSNTMWVESEENKGDFHPLTMKYGEYCSFYGNKCRHFTVPNDSDRTRVSLDFRAGIYSFIMFCTILCMNDFYAVHYIAHFFPTFRTTRHSCTHTHPYILNFTHTNPHTNHARTTIFPMTFVHVVILIVMSIPLTLSLSFLPLSSFIFLSFYPFHPPFYPLSTPSVPSI